MSATDTVRGNKTAILTILSGDQRLILNKVYEQKLLTQREYNNLSNINREDVEGHVTALVDKMLNKGEETCKDFLNLLQTDDDLKATYPQMKDILNKTCFLPEPIQATCSGNSDVPSQQSSLQYKLDSQPVGLCVIINNENFTDGSAREGTDKDARNLAEVFSWLRFRVLMCKDQTKDQMDRTLKCFASLGDVSQLQEFNVEEWSGSGFIDLQEAPKHGDAFICCVLSHGSRGVVSGIDKKPLHVKEITRAFKATDDSALTGKPKVFLIQACQGCRIQSGVLLPDLQADESDSIFILEDADFIVAFATVEDYKAMRHIINGSWFIQSVCQQLKELCPRGEDIKDILLQVNDEVSQKEGSCEGVAVKQMPEVRFTLRKKLVLSPHHN
ncbi:hypothetical protein PAMA_005397 [Pampus argenteus]